MSPAGRIGKVWPPDHGRWPPGEARCFIDMPLNTSPPTANVAALAALAALAEKRRCAEAAVLRAGMKRAAACGRVVAVHGEDRELTRRLAAEASAAGRTLVRDYLDSRPVQAELNAIAWATELAGQTGCPLHIVHVSSPEGLAMIASARAAAVEVTAETCPHYLLFNDKDGERTGALAKCAPPLRDEVRRLAMWQALAAGAVQTIGTDHSPAPMELKESADFFNLWGGMAGCQHGFPLTIAAGLQDHGLTAAELSPLLSGNVAARFGLAGRKGRIAVNHEADLVFLRNDVADRIVPEALLTRHPLSAYTGLSNRCRVVRGQTVWPLPEGTRARGGLWLRPA